MRIHRFYQKFIIGLLVIVMLTGISIHAESISKDDKQNVLILHSYNPSMSWTRGINNSIFDVLSRETYEFYIEYMDTKRFYSESHFSILYELYSNKYSDIDFDVIISTDNNALEFLKSYGKELFGETPVVFCGVNNYSDDLLEGYDRITGVAEEMVIDQNIQLMIDQNPYLEEIVVVSDLTVTGQIFEDSVRAYFNNHQMDYTLTYINEEPLEDMKAILDSLDRRSSVIFGPIYRDGNDDIYDMEIFVKYLSRDLEAYAYSLWDINIGEGLIGGYIISPSKQGNAAALLAKSILDGQSASQLPVMETSPNEYVFDKVQLERYGIDMNLLPDSYRLMNVQPSLYESDPQLFFTLWFVFAVIMVFIVFLIIQYRVTRLRNARLSEEIENKKEMLELQNEKLIEIEKMAALGDLVAGVSHEINTPLGVSITANSYLSDTVTRYENLLASGKMTKNDLSYMMKNVIETTSILTTNLQRAADLVSNFKQIAVDQSNVKKETFDVYRYVDMIVTSLKHEYKNTNHRIHINGAIGMVITSYPHAFIAIITNFIMNSLKHGFAQKDYGDIIIDLIKKEDRMILKYKDEGQGIEPEHMSHIFEPFFTTNRGDGTGLGLNIVYQLVTNQLKGTIDCESSLGEGTTFYIEFPLKDAEDSVDK